MARPRGKLSYMETNTLKEHLYAFFASQPRGICCAYLFGSFARGSARATSDIDVAVLFAKKPPASLAESGVRLSGELEKRLEREVDVIVLNRASVDLIHRVLRDGIIVYDPDPAARIRFEVQSRSVYFDLKPVLDRYRNLRLETPRD